MHTQNDIPYKTYLTEDELPAAWYNLRADMKTKPAPLLSPATGKPVTAGELGASSATNSCGRNWMTRRPGSRSRTRSATSTGCSAPAP